MSKLAEYRRELERLRALRGELDEETSLYYYNGEFYGWTPEGEKELKRIEKQMEALMREIASLEAENATDS